MIKKLIFVLLFATNSFAHDEDIEDALDIMFVNPTHISISGSHLRWDSPSTWGSSGIPGNGSKVLIPVGSSVDFTGDTARIFWIRIKGQLGVVSSGGDGIPGPPVSMTIHCETIIIDETGELAIGSPQIRISKPFTFNFLDSGPINTTWDTRMVSRGLIANGSLKLYGSVVTPFVKINSAAVGNTTITLQSPVVNWSQGDRLVIPGVSFTSNDDDEVTIASINGLQVTLTTALRFNHPVVPNRPIVAANLNRRIILKSESIVTRQRAHFIVMRKPNIEYFKTENLGRSNKLTVTSDFPNLSNPRGRYSLHIHKNGIGSNDPEFSITGAVVENDPGWALVNHSSKVEFLDCIAYRVTGSGFTGETGDELGAFRRNLAIRMTGIGTVSNPATDRGNADFAFSGHGFWAQGGGIIMEDNIATGAAAGAYVFMGDPFRIPGTAATLFPTENLNPPGWAGLPNVLPSQVPSAFKRNIAYGSYDGLVIWSMGGNGGRNGNPGLGNGVPGIGTFEDSYLEVKNNGIVLGYASSQDLLRNTIRGANTWSTFAITNTGVNSGFRYDGNNISGYSVCILDPTNYESWITNNVLQCPTGVLMMNSYQQSGRVVRIEGNQFLDVPQSGINIASNPTGYTYPYLPFQRFQKDENGVPRQKDVTGVYDMVFTSLYLTNTAFGWWTSFFASPNYTDVSNDEIYVNGRRLYLAEYAPEFSTQKMTSIPLSVRQRANGTWRTMGDLIIEFGLYLGGVIIPDDAITDSRITGLLSDNNRTILPTLTVNSTSVFYQITNQTTGFILRVRDASGTFRDFGPFNLVANSWNFPIININGYDRGVPVWCDPNGQNNSW